MKERMESLAEFLEEKAESDDSDYRKGMEVAFKLCAKWIREELEKGD